MKRMYMHLFKVDIVICCLPMIRFNLIIEIPRTTDGAAMSQLNYQHLYYFYVTAKEGSMTWHLLFNISRHKPSPRKYVFWKTTLDLN